MRGLSRARRYSAIAFSIAILLCIAVIYGNSMQTGVSSGGLSRSVTHALNSFLSLISPSLTVSELFVRKAAHFLEFAGLSALISALIFTCFIGRAGGIAKENTSRISLVFLSAPLAALVAIGDETIQLFVDGRVGSPVDVAIDSCGALSAAVTAFLVLLLARNIGKRRTEVAEDDLTKNDTAN